MSDLELKEESDGKPTRRKRKYVEKGGRLKEPMILPAPGNFSTSFNLVQTSLEEKEVAQPKRRQTLRNSKKVVKKAAVKEKSVVSGSPILPYLATTSYDNIRPVKRGKRNISRTLPRLRTLLPKPTVIIAPSSFNIPSFNVNKI